MPRLIMVNLFNLNLAVFCNYQLFVFFTFQLLDEMPIAQSVFERKFFIKHMIEFGLHLRVSASVLGRLVLDHQKDVVIVPIAIGQEVLAELSGDYNLLAQFEVHLKKVFD